MISASVAYFLGWLFVLTAAGMLLPIIFAAAYGETEALKAFMLATLGSGFIGSALVIAFRGRNWLMERRHGLTLLVAGWVLIPVAAAMPFYISGQPGSLIKAYFEAVSGFTTTGATVFSELVDVAKSIIVWRALLQWLGGLATLVGAAFILAPVLGAQSLDYPARWIDKATRSTKRQMKETLNTIVPLYSALTVTCLIFLLFAGMPAFDALCLSFAAVSTGGFMPRDGTLALYGLPSAEIVLTIFTFFGGVSIVWIQALVQARWSIVRATREPLYIAAAILAGGLVLTTLLWLRYPGVEASWFHYLTLGLSTAASLITTSGFPVSEQAFEIVPYGAVILACMIGAGRFSTAGGIKVYRFVAMLRRSARELNLLLFPHGVRPAPYGSGDEYQQALSTVWAAFFLTILVVVVACVAITTTGVPFTGALLAAVTALSNAGPIYEIVRVSELDTSVPPVSTMATATYIVMSVTMILGRIETLAILGLVRLLLSRE